MPIGEVFIMKFFQKFCKVLKPTVCLSLVVVLVFAFCGCKNERIVKKASKGLNNYTITASAGTGGSITPPGETQVAPGGSQEYTVGKGQALQ